MNHGTSLYLDLIRFFAAAMVFVTHASYERFTGGWMREIGLGSFGNDAVVVFFVLSGLVIAYVCHAREKTLRDYALSRAARIYSVVIPCLLLTVILDFAGSRINYAPYAGWWFQTDNPTLRIIANLFLVNELWFSSIRPFSNGPFWSIGYEFWYYVMFGIYFYIRNSSRWWLLGAVILIVGPKILMLMPVWLFGVIAYRCIRLNLVPKSLGWPLFLLPVIVYVIYRYLNGPHLLLSITRSIFDPQFLDNQMAWSKEFVGSYLVGILVATHLVGAYLVSNSLSRVLQPSQQLIRVLAGLTFTLYLLHYPALQFFTAITPGSPQSITHQALVLIGSLFFVSMVAVYTERKKAVFRNIFAQLLSVIERSLESYHARTGR